MSVRPPPIAKNCMKVKDLAGGVRSQWILPGEPLPQAWQDFFGDGNEICDGGPPGILGNCNVGEFDDLGWYYTEDANSIGYTSDLFPSYYMDAGPIEIYQSEGWVLSDVCSKLNGDRPPVVEKLVFDTLAVQTTAPTGSDTYKDPLRNIGTSVYLMNEEKSEGCDGYGISLALTITEYGGHPQYFDAEPWRNPAGLTIGCSYKTCRFVGEVCKYGDDTTRSSKSAKK
mmetsp:Transcript_28403/g.63661  ORF Transcript_28403/g.63661 Transcript_28403/m.63661 type:complete len:227 (+) Transcript_28403:229-909(+)